MNEEAVRSLPFPPLMYPPRWADAALPDRDDMMTLRAMIEGTLSTLDRLQLVLNTSSTPSYHRLQRSDLLETPIGEVLAVLEQMACPADMTVWLDTGRTLARQTVRSLDDCRRATGQLLLVEAETSSYQRCLAAARQSGGRAYQQCRSLDHHIGELVLNVYDSQ